MDGIPLRKSPQALSAVLSEKAKKSLFDAQRFDIEGFINNLSAWGEKWRKMAPLNLGLATPQLQRRFGKSADLPVGSFCYQLNAPLTRSNVTILDDQGKILLVRLCLERSEWKVDQLTF